MRHICEVISITTPKKYILKGLLFGPAKPKKAIIFVHGLTGSPFSHHEILEPLVDSETAVLFFGNRGSQIIAKFHKIDKRKGRGFTSHFLGEAHEVFTDSADDIQGVVNFLNKREVEEIYLVGHSTGCQKSIYFASLRGKQKYLKGIALLCPVSDFAYANKFEKETLKVATPVARKMVKEGKGRELLPADISPELLDAQRFLSLNTPDSTENQVFPYFDPKAEARALKRIRVPLLAVFAEKDEFRDRKTFKLVEWFRENNMSVKFDAKVIPGSGHSFFNHEGEVCKTISDWVEEN